jgi:hypothetical protein
MVHQLTNGIPSTKIFQPSSQMEGKISALVCIVKRTKIADWEKMAVRWVGTRWLLLDHPVDPAEAWAAPRVREP